MNGQKPRYTAVIWDYSIKGSKRLKAFNSLKDAENYIRDFLEMHEHALDNVMIVHGEILMIGEFRKGNSY